MTKDPVCGMDIDEKMAAGRSEYQGKVYYFCAPGCLKDFEKEPDQYVKTGETMIDRSGTQRFPKNQPRGGCHS